MTKSQKIDKGTPVSWRDKTLPRDDGSIMALDVMNVMEQGIIVWSDQGICELHNTRIFDILELERDAITIGTRREDFLAAAIARGEFNAEKLKEHKRRFAAHVPFKFDRALPSGRVVASYARPTREGGFVVTFTDVTDVRKSLADLDVAKKAAEEAEAKAQEVLQDERTRRAEARTLSQLDEWLQSCKSLDELFRIVAKFMGHALPASSGELYLYSNSRDVLDGACEWGQVDLLREHITADCCWSLRRGRTYIHDPDTVCFPCDHLRADIKDDPGSYICIPVIAHGDTVGLLHISIAASTSREDARAMSRFATRSAEHISMAIANVKLRDELHDQSIRDPLTGLYNRRYFMDAMRRETAAADRGGKGYGLISFDADKFKMFNDNHGHEAGDTVLRALAERMLAVLPDTSVCARVGGEEFAVLLPKCDMKNAVKHAEALRVDVAEMDVRTAYGALPSVTISSGVAVHTGDATPPNVLMKRADEALYAAKAGGRNRVEVAKNKVSKAVP